MRALVTGGSGFVGRWLAAHLTAWGDEVSAPGAAAFDVTDGAAAEAVLAETRPDAVYHLAGLAHVGESWEAPVRTFEVNALGALHVLEAARRLEHRPRVLLVGSAEVYGAVCADDLPIAENQPLRPVTPYAVSKVAAEFLGLQAYLAHGLPVVAARAFNHAGPGQSDAYVVSSLARQIALAERSGERSIVVGNIAPSRDFTDVRDVVRAYRLLVERADAGLAYNVCSGCAVPIEEVARRLIALSGTDLGLEVDQARVRPVDVPVLLGDASRLSAATGWSPQITLDQTLADTLAYWRERLAVS